MTLAEISLLCVLCGGFFFIASLYCVSFDSHPLMQRLLEQKSPFVMTSATATGPSSTRSSGGRSVLLKRHVLVSVVAVMVAAAYVAFVLLPSWSATEVAGELHFRKEFQMTASVTGTSTTLPPRPPSRVGGSKDIDGKKENHAVLSLEPWGYNKDRNVPRWEAIYQSILRDFGISAGDRVAAAGISPFTLVDYGSDQGYFSISTRHFFPSSVVMGLELGGVGGEIWNKGKKVKDVLSIQEEHLDRLAIAEVPPSFIICQTSMQAQHFTQLQRIQARSDYQLMLSVFHWFPLPTRADFEVAIVTLFSNAKTTFIELPTIGDKSELIRKQVGYKNIEAWYDGRTDIRTILLDAAEAQGADIRVELVLSSKWIRWTREVFRVDFIGWKKTPDSGTLPVAARTGTVSSVEAFSCDARKRIYGCKERERFHACPETPPAITEPSPH